MAWLRPCDQHVQLAYYGRRPSHHGLGARVQGRRVLRVVLRSEYPSRGRVEAGAYPTPAQHARRAKVSRGNERWDVKAFDLDTLVLIHFGNTDGHRAVFQATVQTVLL